MVDLYARIGVVVPMSDEDYDVFCELSKKDERSAAEFFWKKYSENHRLDGESYVPDGFYMDMPHVGVDL